MISKIWPYVSIEPINSWLADDDDDDYDMMLNMLMNMMMLINMTIMMMIMMIRTSYEYGEK